MSDFDKEDMELKAMMGNQFIDATEPITEAKARETYKKACEKYDEAIKNIPDDIKEGIKARGSILEARDAGWHPTKQRYWMDDLKDVTKSTLIFGGLNVLIWYWQLSGLMDESIALPCMLVCAVLAGLGIGKVLGRK